MASGERKGNGRARRNGQFMPAMILSGHGAAIVAMFPPTPPPNPDLVSGRLPVGTDPEPPTVA